MDMFLLSMTILCVLFGSSVTLITSKGCVGKRYLFPYSYTSPAFKDQIYFTPSKGGPRTLILDGSVGKVPRLQVSKASIYLTDLTEEDNGVFSISYGHDYPLAYDVITLTVSVCTDSVTKTYGESYYCKIPRQAEFLDFAPHLSDTLPKVLWNSSDPQTSLGGRGQVRGDSWEIISATQEDSGYYDFRGKDRKLLSRTLIKVEGKILRNEKYVGEVLIIRYPSADSAWTVDVKLEEERKYINLVNAGIVVTESNPEARAFNGRVHLLHDGMQITLLETRDSGTYTFKDPQNNLGLIVLLEVQPAPTSPKAPLSALLIFGIVVGYISLTVICFCCAWKCFEKWRSSDNAQAAHQTETALPVYYHNQNQSSGQSHSYQPVPLGAYGDTAAYSFEPPDYDTVMNSLQPEVEPLGGQGGTPAPSLGSDCLSSDPGPRFELTGLTGPSAPPLSSDSTACGVYSSDKLNYLSGAL
ncbi:uncharacterized protein LOC117818093 [Notolabrus celidotus]|uniref:uncharacterized protein LOC117818093 n=1 Tax=Notolabrus celidotus TaxID=1203425 RepID=UPI00148FD31D|nr:uncharacterized protein LOC117818093 [Notolabrus celidotus]